MKYGLFFIFFSSFLLLSAQTITVTAEKGDGIFSLLRKQGLNPSKYYAQFIELNQSTIKNGSELVLGQEYLVPDAPDSFKKMAVNAKEDLKEDAPIFTNELAGISAKSSKLDNAVLYLLPGINGITESQSLKLVRNQIMKDVAQELMVHGAKVYLVEELKDSIIKTGNKEVSLSEEAIANRNQLQHFVGTINKHSLQNSGKYQRVVVLNFNQDAANARYYSISLFHHEKSEEGERFAKTFEDIFNAHSLRKTKEAPIAVFENPGNLYLVKNVVPPVTMIDVSGVKNTGNGNRISIRPREALLTDIITNGVLTDYANLSLTEED